MPFPDKTFTASTTPTSRICFARSPVVPRSRGRLGISATGLQYADQRYYASNFGRFMSSDRYKASGRAKDPGSWNRYAYTRGDPANRFDPSGRFDCDPEDDDCDP